MAIPRQTSTPSQSASTNDGPAAPGAGNDAGGLTAPAQPPSKMPMPRVGANPIGQSGRANFSGLPQPDEFNPELVGNRGLWKYNEMYRTDAHVRRLILAAWSPLVAATWNMDPFGGDDASDQDRQIAEDIWWILTKWMSPNLFEHLYEVGPILLRSGFTPYEQIWDVVERNGRQLQGPRTLQVRLPWTVWRWWQDVFGQLTYIGQILPQASDITIPASDLLYYRLGPEGDNWMGTPLLRHAYKHWVMKDRLERIDVIGQERKAVGLPVVYPPTGASEEQKDALEQLLMSVHMSEAQYLMMPGPKAGSTGAQGVPNEEWLVDVIKFDSSSGSGILDSIAYHQQAMAGSFLEDFLELGHHQVGARATAEVQEDPFLTAINGALLPPVLPQLNRLVDRIRCVNWPDADGSPTLKLTLNDEASLSEIAGYVVPFVTSEVIQVDPELEDWIRDRAGMPAANAEIRAKNLAAKEAGLVAAQKLAETGQTPGSEPPSPNAPQTAAPPAGPAPSPAGTGGPEGDDADSDASKRLDDAIDTMRSLLDALAGGTNAPDGLQMVPAIAGAVCEHDDPDVKDGVCQLCGLPVPTVKLDDSSIRGAGLAIRAQDTGRILLIARSYDDHDAPEIRTLLEFPGGTLEPGEQPLAAATREFTEEVGVRPANLTRLGQLTSGDGAYRLFVCQTAHETDIAAGHYDKTEVAGCQWTAPQSLTEGRTSPRMRALVPAVQRILNRSGQLDDQPTAKWWERLMSQDQLRQALDGCRDHIQAACDSQTVSAARQVAGDAANGKSVANVTAPDQLVNALERHYSDLYNLGGQTVDMELGVQRHQLASRGLQPAITKTTLDAPSGPSASGGIPDALARAGQALNARARAEHSAQNIVNKVVEQMGRDQIAGQKTPADMTTSAVKVARGQLRVEALANTAAQINDGRAAAAATAGDVVGAYYTSCMDGASCQPCIDSDTGALLSPTEALAIGTPNPLCLGGDYCRCALVWVLSDDPAALGLS